ncbi:MAG: hypothetical protein GX051_09510 [Clostridiales bacterium]|nr:hypothetical protein [Clostridiales bacterium]
MQNHNFDYSKTMLLKIDIGNPDNKGGCKLINTFAEVLEKIKSIDAITCGAPKIVYLVGWQYNGHDDRYPEFFEVNEHAKLPGMTARESLLYLIEEAKKYHTTVSLHINLSDIYKESELWQEYIDNDLVLRKANGSLKPTGTWNSRTAYQVRFAEELKSGYFKKRVDRLFELVPLSEIGTVHIDAFFVRRGKSTSIKSEKAARREMIKYFNSLGCDVTSEFIYREWRCGYRAFWGKCDTLGLIPAVWNLRMTQREYMKYHPSLLAGGTLTLDLQVDKKLQYLFYENMHGEGVCAGEEWWKKFLHDFAIQTVPYFYLNEQHCERISGIFDSRIAHFTNGIETRIKNCEIRENGHVVKKNETLMLPVNWEKNAYFAYSKSETNAAFPFPFKSAVIMRVTPEGLKTYKTITANGALELEFSDDCAYFIKGENA